MRSQISSRLKEHPCESIQRVRHMFMRSIKSQTESVLVRSSLLRSAVLSFEIAIVLQVV